MLESYVLERRPSSFSTETYKHKIRAHTYTHHILTDTRKNKWTQDNNITSIIAYTYKNNEREREWQNANASMDLFVYRHNQKHLLTNTHTNTRIFNQQINKHKQTIKRREKRRTQQLQLTNNQTVDNHQSTRFCHHNKTHTHNRVSSRSSHKPGTDECESGANRTQKRTTFSVIGYR